MALGVRRADSFETSYDQKTCQEESRRLRQFLSLQVRELGRKAKYVVSLQNSITLARLY